MRAALAFAFAALAAPAFAADASHPNVVELFQSQGCSSCPPANASLARYADRADMLALTFAVTYWDRLGWKDTFARPEYTERQYAYARSLGDSGVYTPEVVVNGRAAGVGDDVSEVEALARKTDRGASGPEVRIEGGAVSIGAGDRAGRRRRRLARALRSAHARSAGRARRERRAARSRHRNVVKRLVRLGVWDGAAVRLTLPAAGGLARAVLVQQRGVGPILAAARG